MAGSSECSITAASLTVGSTSYAGVITDTATVHTIVFTVPKGTTVTSLTPTLTLSTGATASPTSAQNFTTSKIYTVTAEDTTTTKQYVVSVIDDSKPKKVAMRYPGWSNVRVFEGDLDEYASGGITLPLAGFAPLFVINVQILGGAYVGAYDVKTGKLKVYSVSDGSEISAMAGLSFSVILMGQ